jgi:hypothetical protein
MSYHLRRLRPAGVQHLAVWDLPLSRGLFWERVGAPRIGEMRDLGASAGEIARALADDIAEALGVLQLRDGFDVAYLGGGLLGLPGVRTTLVRHSPCALAFNPDGRFVGERGGKRLLAQIGRPHGAIVDVGQTAIKATTGARRATVERDLGALPLRLIDTCGRSSGAPTATVAAFISSAVATIGPPDACVLLAIPGPLGESLLPGPCTYGWEGDATLLPALVERLEKLQPAPAGELLLVNDAELAGVSAQVDLRRTSGARALALTLGFGPGAALLDAGAQSAYGRADHSGHLP